MRWWLGIAMASAASVAIGGIAAAAPQPPRTFVDTLSLPKFIAQIKPAKADSRIAYGPAKSQIADLYLPRAAKRPPPIVILVHGGCWNTEAPLDMLAPVAAELAAAGVAVWSIEYRRIGEPGGGYPGMYQDVAAAFDKLRAVAAEHRLDLTRITVVGHSAGGHLGMWGAARPRLPAGHKWRGPDPLPVRAVINVGGSPDIYRTADLLPLACGPDVKIAQIVGEKTAERPDPFADTSASKMLPLGIRTRSIMGEYDDIVPPYAGLWWQRFGVRKNEDVDTVTIRGAGHFDLVATTEPEWQQVKALILAEARR